MDILKIHRNDTVAVALRKLSPGESAGGVTLRESVAEGHKLALININPGEPVIKYGHPIGLACAKIRAGEWVHSHNLQTGLSGCLEYNYNPDRREIPQKPPCRFQGYKREDGTVGIRNELWIIPTVGCVNALARAVAEESRAGLPPEIDGVFPYAHPYGCSQLGGDLLNTQKALCGMIRHPNAAGVLVLGLGCENNLIDSLKEVLGEYDPRRVKFLNCQDVEDDARAALELLEELKEYAKSFRREPCDASSLIVGLKCGGSDGFSGITANPLLGGFSDELISQGGTAILTEVPEMFGAETVLMNRCRTELQFEKTVELINDFKEYFISHDQPVGENPSPGNKEGGITTLEEKSLGCVQKGGAAPVEDVLGYGSPVKCRGLNLLQAPGNDLVATAALMISGAQIVLFTTGRGTPLGCAVPTLKVSSNTPLFSRKMNWCDFDGGRLLSGEGMEDLTQELFTLVLEIASGEKKAKSESLDKSDFAIFKSGVTL